MESNGARVFLAPLQIKLSLFHSKETGTKYCRLETRRFKKGEKLSTFTSLCATE